jgi:hypothetical protein
VVAEVGEDEVNGNLDYYYERRNFETLAGARRFAKTAKGAVIYHRVNIHEDTPRDSGEPRHAIGRRNRSNADIMEVTEHDLMRAQR